MLRMVAGMATSCRPTGGRRGWGRTAVLKSLSRPLIFFSHWQFLTKENDEEEKERWAERL